MNPFQTLPRHPLNTKIWANKYVEMLPESTWRSSSLRCRVFCWWCWSRGALFLSPTVICSHFFLDEPTLTWTAFFPTSGVWRLIVMREFDAFQALNNLGVVQEDFGDSLEFIDVTSMMHVACRLIPLNEYAVCPLFGSWHGGNSCSDDAWCVDVEDGTENCEIFGVGRSSTFSHEKARAPKQKTPSKDAHSLTHNPSPSENGTTSLPCWQMWLVQV